LEDEDSERGDEKPVWKNHQETNENHEDPEIKPVFVTPPVTNDGYHDIVGNYEDE
jgi:hypothetical protein